MAEYSSAKPKNRQPEYKGTTTSELSGFNASWQTVGVRRNSHRSGEILPDIYGMWTGRPDKKRRILSLAII
jgi:hypothetical protein